MKHSPAPFTFVKCKDRAAIVDRNGMSIATLVSLSPGEHIDANGNLFAASPELLAACHSAIKLMRGSGFTETAATLMQLKLAIAKAEVIE